jgi:hypothetical protein
VRLGEGSKPMAREIWLMVHPELRDLTRVKAVMGWLQETARKLT